MTSNRSRARRQVIAAISIGATLSVAPLLPFSTSVSADAPAVAVTGLSRGSKGDAVKQVQQALVNQGLSVAGGVDGVFGPGTENALKTFQQRQGLNSTGVVDDATALALGLSSSPLLGLTQGTRGDDVKLLQQKLQGAGITVVGGADGVFGPGTTAAVKSFQSAKGYSPTGVVNAATAAALGGVKAAKAAPKQDEPKQDEPKSTDGGAQAESTKAGSAASGLVGLKIGARNDQVKALQRAIMAAGFTVVGGADGIFGALTANALKSFQNANGLEANGVVDKATAKALAGVRNDESAPADDHDPAVSNPYTGLRYGSLGADVKSLQSALISAGIAVYGGADGVYGRATESAVKQFQAARKLEQTGKVDEATANALSSGAKASGGSNLTGLKAGALGNTVKSLQQSLLDAGIDVRGGADGIFGPATANAVKSFQTSQGLPATGTVDQATADALANPAKPVAEPAAEAPSGGAKGFAAYGEKGSRVMALQSALVNAGIAVRGGVDGDFGSGTAAAVMDFQRAQGFTVTGKVDERTAGALGLDAVEQPSAPEAGSVELKAFPMQGPCGYTDTWHATRGGGRVHLGVDIIAAGGQELYAVADGTITKIYVDQPGSLSGNGVRLTMADGTYFFYAHMVSVADGLKVGSKVKAGDVVGYNGKTGNTNTNHLHLEIHPQGGSAINPYPLIKAIDGC